MQKELSSTETITKSISLMPPPMKNTSISLAEKEEQTSNIKKRTSVNELKSMMTNTDFEQVVFSKQQSTEIINDNITTTKNSTSKFLKLFVKYKICSQRHFLTVLKQDDNLMDAYLHLPYNLCTQIINKGLTVAQSCFTPNTFLDKYNSTVIDESKKIKRLAGIFNEFLQIISCSNFNSRNDLLKNIFDVLLTRDNKKMTIGFIGPSNTGKTFLADIVCGSFNAFEIGNIIPPAKDILSEIWLANCVYASIKRMEEFFIPTQAIFNAFKQLLEGNTNQIANVKYKDNLNLPCSPTVLTMNGIYKTDIINFVPMTTMQLLTELIFIF